MNWKPPIRKPRFTRSASRRAARTIARFDSGVPPARPQLLVSSSNAATASLRRPSALAGLTFGALGVVYGDIGTSPLYSLKEVFHGGLIAVTPENILGVLSLLFWTLTIVVSVKYVLLILRADNNGEGGLIAMLALATNAVNNKPLLRRKLLLLGLFGTAIFFGDAVITPAMTVLGAVEGIDVYAPDYDGLILPITLLVLTGLFTAQRMGTGGIGRAFGSVMLLWFLSLAALGLPHILANPDVLVAVNPMYALRFCLEHHWAAFLGLGAVVLVVTGGEALYADLGHFGRKPIRIAWYGVVMPSLVMNYFGQGAMLLERPEAVKNPFFLLAPPWAEIPLFALATLAAIVASQALITAAYSVTKQAIQMGLLPRMRILHTSVRDIGQIYVPFINWGLFTLIVLAVVFFGSSSKLAGAYGIAVTIDMTITTIMTFFVIRHGWGYPLALSVLATGFFFAIDVTYLASNALKLLHGGWFPLTIGAGMFTLMLTWKQGRRLLQRRLREDAIELKVFLEAVFLSPPLRVPGTAVFLSADVGVTPNALLHNLKHNKVLHEQNLFVTVKHHETPWVGFDKRCAVEALGNDCWAVQLHFGFKNEPDVPEALTLLASRGVHLDEMETSYFLSRDIVIPNIHENSGMADWREKLFASMHRNAAAAADFLHLPTNRIVELGSKLEI
ncbi:MAG: potassium transporter Kup [Paucibacter sp.]|nr:potassium transporter Kup [Roseateles sp.]